MGVRAFGREWGWGRGGEQHFLFKISHQYLTSIIIVSSGNYQDSLSDVRAATALQPTHLKAIVRGKEKRRER